jgi:hypothetical protein
LFTINPTWIDPETNPGLRSERAATNCLSHGTAQMGGWYKMYLREIYFEDVDKINPAEDR